MSGLWGSNVIFQLKPHKKRKKSATQIVNQLKNRTQNIPSIDVFPWSWNSGLPGYGDNNSQDINFVLKTMDSYDALFKEAEKAQQTLNIKFQGTHHDLNLDAAAYEIVLDRLKLAQTKLSPLQISQTVQIYFGGLELYEYFQDMMRYPIRIVSSNAPGSLDEIYMTTAEGVRVPIGQFAKLKHTALPTMLQHHNQMRSVEVSVPYKGSISSAMFHVKSLMKGKTTSTTVFEWTGNAKAYLESSATIFFMLLMALVFIYSILAIQFESFIDPLIIIVTVPLGIAGALFGLWIMGCSLNIYSYIDLITLIGVITKHGILIVEFANQQLREGLPIEEAVKHACALRFRPIIMTTCTTVLGALPLIITGGAGSENRFVIGVTLIGGMTIGTILTLTLLPLVFQMVHEYKDRISSILTNPDL